MEGLKDQRNDEIKKPEERDAGHRVAHWQRRRILERAPARRDTGRCRSILSTRDLEGQIVSSSSSAESIEL